MSDAMSDFFGDLPNRPTHPDFWKLSEIVLGMDAMTEEPDGFERAVAEANVDPRSLVYTANQRARRAYHGDDPDALMAITAVYLDGFIAGTRYNEQRGQQSPEEGASS